MKYTDCPQLGKPYPLCGTHSYHDEESVITKDVADEGRSLLSPAVPANTAHFAVEYNQTVAHFAYLTVNLDAFDGSWVAQLVIGQENKEIDWVVDYAEYNGFNLRVAIVESS